VIICSIDPGAMALARLRRPPARGPSRPRAVSPRAALHVRAPLVRSEPLSAALGHEVLLKLDTVQPSGSFKLRGLGLAAEEAKARGVGALVSSSGGNAGLAVAYAGRALGMSVRVVVPTTTPAAVCDKLRDLGAEVEVTGAVWAEANDRATELADQLGAELMHPFEGEATWRGHGSLVAELAEDLGGHPPAAVVCSVGGGGLALGILSGLDAAGWGGEVPLVCCETLGADSFAQAAAAGELVTLPGISSVAKSLGATRVSPTLLAQHEERGPGMVRPWTCSDAEAVGACARLLDDHRALVEPACGAALAAAYCRAPPLVEAAEAAPGRPVVVEVCGGAAVDRAALEGWLEQLTPGGR